MGAVDGREHPNPAMPTTPHLLLGLVRDLLPEGDGQAMSTDTDSLREGFTVARMNLYRAQIQLERRDSPENRKALGAAVEEIDAVLDMWLEVKGDCE